MDAATKAAFRELLQQELGIVQAKILEETRKEIGTISSALHGYGFMNAGEAKEPFQEDAPHDKTPDGAEQGELRSSYSGCSEGAQSTATKTPKGNTVVQDISKVIDDHLTKSRSQPAKTRVQVIVRSQSFEMFFAAVVVSNAVIVGIRADAGANDRSVFYDTLELLIALLFLVELAMRFAAAGLAYFKYCIGVWNFFDALLVIFMLADAVCALMGMFMFGIDDGGLMRLYRVLRLVRVARMARLFHLVPELNFTLSLMLQSMSSFFWAAVLMMLIMYLVALYFTIVSMQFVDTLSDPTQLQAYWGSTGASMNSLFLAVFGGEDWHDMLLVFDQSSGWYVVNSMVLSLFVGFVLVVILNLVNGVLVDGAQVMIADQKRNELVRMAAEIFVHTGRKAGDELSKEEFDLLLRSEEMSRYLDAIGIEFDEADRLFDFLDRDESGSLSIVEFIQGCLRLRGPAKALDLAEMHLWSKEKSMEIIGRFSSLESSMRELMKKPVGILVPSSGVSEPSSRSTSPLPPVDEDSPPDVVPRPSPDHRMLLQLTN